MRTAITTGLRRDGVWETVMLQDKPVEEHLAKAKSFANAGTHPRYSEVRVWTSDGGEVKRVKLSAPAPAQVTTEQPKPEQPAKQKVRQ